MLVGAQRQRVLNDLVEVNQRARRLTLPRKGQELPDDACGALGFTENDVNAAARGVPTGLPESSPANAVPLATQASKAKADEVLTVVLPPMVTGE